MVSSQRRPSGRIPMLSSSLGALPRYCCPSSSSRACMLTWLSKHHLAHSRVSVYVLFATETHPQGLNVLIALIFDKTAWVALHWCIVVVPSILPGCVSAHLVMHPDTLVVINRTASPCCVQCDSEGCIKPGMLPAVHYVQLQFMLFTILDSSCQFSILSMLLCHNI